MCSLQPCVFGLASSAMFVPGFVFSPSSEMFIFHAGFSQETEFNHDVLCGRLTSFPRLQHAGAALASSLLLWSSAYIIVSASSYSQDCGIQEKMLNQTTCKAGNYPKCLWLQKVDEQLRIFFCGATTHMRLWLAGKKKRSDP